MGKRTRAHRATTLLSRGPSVSFVNDDAFRVDKEGSLPRNAFNKNNYNAVVFVDGYLWCVRFDFYPAQPS